MVELGHITQVAWLVSPPIRAGCFMTGASLSRLLSYQMIADKRERGGCFDRAPSRQSVSRHILWS
jgi:hypothetical protein